MLETFLSIFKSVNYEISHLISFISVRQYTCKSHTVTNEMLLKVA